MPTKTKRVLLFDIDGTLLDPAREGSTCLRRALEDVYGLTGPIDHYSMAGKTDWKIITDLMEMAGLDGRTIEASLPAAFAAYARHVEAAAPTFKMQVLPGVIELLTQLAGHPEFILGLVTGNVRETAPHKLRAVGLDPGWFTFGAFGSEHVDRNHLPALALYRLEQQLGLPVPPEKALVIGDTPYDIACARHVGLKVLSVATGPYSCQDLADHKPDYLIDDLVDTQAVMAILSGF